MSTTMTSLLDLSALAAGPAFGAAAALVCVTIARRAAERALPEGGDRRTQRQAFTIIAAACVAFALALPLAVAWLPADAVAAIVVPLGGGFAWLVALQAVRLERVAREAGLAPRPIAMPAFAMPAPRPIGQAERWTGLGATLLGLGLAMAGELAGGLMAALG